MLSPAYPAVVTLTPSIAHGHSQHPNWLDAETFYTAPCLSTSAHNSAAEMDATLSPSQVIIFGSSKSPTGPGWTFF